MTTLHCDAFLFDVDSTLVDSAACIANVWRRWAGLHGLDFEHVHRSVHGRTVMSTLQEAAPHLANGDSADEVQRLAVEEFRHMREVKGARDFLLCLPADGWAVATSGPRKLSLGSMANAGLPVPAAVVAGEDVVRGKPDPEPYMSAARLLGVPPERCVVFEDSLAGIASGQAAGARVLALATTHTESELAGVPGLAAVIRDFSQLRLLCNPPGGPRFSLVLGGPA